MGSHTIINDNGPYQTRHWLGRLRLHIFYRGDVDPDAHDHPWPFYTFPLHSYVEEVWRPDGQGGYFKRWDVVRAWRLHYRPATHLHRVLGRWSGEYHFDIEGDPVIAGLWVKPGVKEGTIITIVWRGRKERTWGFMKDRAGRWCWQHWKQYTSGGRNQPCSDDGE